MMQPCTINVYTIGLAHHKARLDVAGVRVSTMQDLVEVLEIEQAAAATRRNAELAKGASPLVASKAAKERDLLVLVVGLFAKLAGQGFALPVPVGGKTVQVQVCDGVVLMASDMAGAEKRICYLPESGHN